MKRINKKGFTIVELVIVIAVIAILAGVLIPTFTGLIRKANVSSDTQLVRNLNTALTTDAALNGKHETMQDVLDGVSEYGFDLAKIMNTKVTENTVLWDSENDIFCYLNNGEVTYIPNSTDGTLLPANDYRLWKIYASAEKELVEGTSEKYSAYLTGEGWEQEITVNSKGLDVGTSTGIKTINYRSDNNNKVSICTNDTIEKLCIEAELASVNHYGDIQHVNIIKVAPQSYHEYGKAGYVEIASGRFVVEANAKVIALVGTTANVTVKAEANATIDKAFSTVENLNTTGNVALETKVFTEAEKNELQNNAEAQIINAVAVNGVYYKTVKAAFDEVASKFGQGQLIDEDCTITLYKNINENGIVVKSGVTVIFDLNGYTYNVVGTVGSENTTTNGFQLNKGADVTFKNGTLTSSKALILAQNYCNLTLENMILDGSGSYTLSNNNGNVIIKDSTIIAKENCYAFDVCSFGGYTGPNITVQNSIIEGNIEFSYYDSASVENMCLTLKPGTTINGTIFIINEAVDGKLINESGKELTIVKSYLNQ